MTKAQVTRKVRRIINPLPLGEEFACDFLADLILDKHYYCSRHRLRPVQFRKMPRTVGDYDFQGWFAERKKWHSVSWSQCIRPRRDHDWIARALRDAIAPEIARYRWAHPICERCQLIASEEVHHVLPTFREIVRRAVGALTEADWQDIVDQFDWWEEAPFSLPRESPALAVLREAHKRAQLQAVCGPCHNELESQG